MTTGHTAPADDTAGPRAGAPTARRRVALFLRDVVIIIVIAVLVSFIVKTFLVRSFYIPSASMEQTLQVDDRIFVDQITPRFTDYQRGDVVVFRDPGGWLAPTARIPRPPFVESVEWLLSLVGLAAPDSEDHLVKRIIGLPGDHVVCCNALGQIEVNGVPVDEGAYLKLSGDRPSPLVKEYDVVVPAGSLWVLGDNRDRSQDSRYHTGEPGQGFVPVDNVVGRAFFTVWPFAHLGPIDAHHEVFGGVPEPAGTDATVP